MIAPAHNITIESGTTVSLNCSAKHESGQDCSMCLVWKHGDVPVTNVKFTLVDGKIGSSLLITVDTSTQGEYICQANGKEIKEVKRDITAASENIHVMHVQYCFYLLYSCFD